MKLFKENVLVIGDLHLPFEKEGYMKFCKTVYKKYKCNRVIFAGDLIDSHASSYHEHNPDGMSAGDELELAIKMLKPWYKAFPTADVCSGNHDNLILRKAFTNGLSKKWIKDFNEVLEVPNWTFAEEFIYNDVHYAHGHGGSANLLNTVINNRFSLVRGHYHTQLKVEYSVTDKDCLFGLSVGCGIDAAKYAFEYAKGNLKQPAIGCGVVLNNGKLPIAIPMDI